MRVLFITNLGSERCGVKEYGEIWVRELRKVGVDIAEWDGTYSSCVANGYLPRTGGLHGFDLIHLNWDPQTINHYLPEHFPQGIPLSVFLHDSPDDSSCPLFERADLLMGYVGGVWRERAVHQLDHAVPPADYEGTFGAPPEDHVRVGVTGIRDDPGHRMVRDLCRERGWEFYPPEWWANPGAAWLESGAEIARLASCTFNVCWYHTSGRGKSMAAMFCCAARRPLLLSSSTMFSVLEPYAYTGLRPAEVYQSTAKPCAGVLEAWCDMVLEDVRAGRARLPGRLLRELSWQGCAHVVKARWQYTVADFKARGGRG